MLLVRADVIVQRVHFFASAGIAVTRGRPTIRACSFTYGWAAILVHSASAFIEDCEMTGGRGAAIQVVGWPLFDALAPKASVLIRRNVIQGGDPDTGYDTGIRVDLGASVLIEDNRIEDIRRGGYSDDRGNGIELLGSGRIDVRRNLVRAMSSRATAGRRCSWRGARTQASGRMCLMCPEPSTSCRGRYGGNGCNVARPGPRRDVPGGGQHCATSNPAAASSTMRCDSRPPLEGRMLTRLGAIGR
jgi:hypothetical protein